MGRKRESRYKKRVIQTLLEIEVKGGRSEEAAIYHSLQDENKVYTNLCASPFFLGMERQYQIISELLRRRGTRLK